MRSKTGTIVSRRTGILMGAVTILLGLTSIVGPVPQAQAAPSSCHATSCAGWDPTSVGCTVTSTTTSGGSLGTVWNRFAYGCDANWVRGQLSPAAVSAGDTMYVIIVTQESNGTWEQACYPSYTGEDNVGRAYEDCGNPYSGSSVIYSDMVDGTNLTYAYLSIFDTSGNRVAQYEANQ